MQRLPTTIFAPLIPRYWILLVYAAFGVMLPFNLPAATLSITELEDIDFGDVPPTADLARQRIRVCVNMTPAGPYNLTGIGAGAGGAFQLNQPGNPSANLDYTVFVGTRGRRARQELEPGVPSDSLMARQPRPNGSCRPPYLNVVVLIDANDLRTAPGGAYQGRLEPTVAPE